MLDAAGQSLRSELLELFNRPVDDQLEDSAFDAYALDVVRYQLARNEPYAAYCERRGVSARTVAHWSQIPPVPAGAFKIANFAVNDAPPEAVFLTSGTTGGSERRGVHSVPDISLYHGSLLPNFRARLFPDRAQMPMLSLLPPSHEMPESSLAHMITYVMHELGGEGSAHCATTASGIDTTGLEAMLEKFVASGAAVCLLGTSFSYVHWIDDMRARGASFELPPGSRLMDTGGYKGRSREVPPHEMVRAYDELLGIPPHMCVNEYGMTELCSQMYDAGLTDAISGRPVRPRVKRPPPWLRVRIVDPVTLQPVNDGESGLVQLFDLANLGSVIAIQTEDLGVAADGGYRVTGRTPGATPRGCSIAMDDLQRAVRDIA